MPRARVSSTPPPVTARRRRRGYGDLVFAPVPLSVCKSTYSSSVLLLAIYIYVNNNRLEERAHTSTSSGRAVTGLALGSDDDVRRAGVVEGSFKRRQFDKPPPSCVPPPVAVCLCVSRVPAVKL